MTSPRMAIIELGRRALIPASRDDARAILLEIANSDIPAVRRKLAARLLAESSTIDELLTTIGPE